MRPRLYVEERRRLKIIPNGFNEKPMLKLMFGALVRAADPWRGLRFISCCDPAAGKVVPAPRFLSAVLVAAALFAWLARLG